jgi:hypothetical protein
VSTGSLFVVSDVHGHVEDLRRGLRRADLIDGSDRWAGDDAELWVLGDLVDRGPDGVGVIELLRSLQEQAPGQVHVLMGNHEALAVGCKLFPDSRFAEAWLINGGLRGDQERLTDDHVTWLRTLPVLARVRDFLFMHSDTGGYLEWGSSVDEVNETVTSLLVEDDVDVHWEVFATLTHRYDFARGSGAGLAADMLRTLGGGCIVHGHSIIGSLIDVPSPKVDGPIRYADGLVIAIDGGRYDGGPLLVVQLD